MPRRQLLNLKTPAELDARRRAALRSADGTPPTAKLAEFGLPGPLRDRLLEAIPSCEKTATSSLVAEYEAEGEPLPQVGERQTVIDSGGRAVAIIEVVAVAVIRLGDADLSLAVAEGEGFRSVAQWREEHERFWTDEVRPHLGHPATWRLDDDTQVVVERFRLVDRLLYR